MQPLTTQIFIERSKSKYPHRNWNYDKTKYTGTKDKVTITCEQHGDFHVFPGNHIGPKSTECRGCKGWVPDPEVLSQAFLRTWFNYEPDTGLITVRATGRIFGAVTKPHGYIKGRIGKRSYDVHRLAFLFQLGRIPEMVDHIDQDPTNNKWENLRASTNELNQKNVSRENLRLTEDGYYRVQAQIQTKTYSKSFKSKDDAIAFRDELHALQEARHNEYHKKFIDNDIVSSAQ